MTPSPVTTGNPTLDKLRAGQFEDPQVQQAIALARQTGTLPPPDQAPNADVAQQPRPIAGPSTPQPGLVDPAAGRIQPTAASPIASLAGPAPLSAHQQEYNRITKPPIEAGALKHTQADTGRSGIGQIKHAGFRIPLEIADAIGSAFLPSLTSMIPGTELHHQMRVGGESRALGLENEQATGEATREHLGSQTKLAGAQADEATARANSLNNADKYSTVKAGEGVYDTKNNRWLVEPTSGDDATEIDAATGKSLHIVPTKDGRYLLPKGGASLLKPPEEAKTPFEAWRKQNPDKPAEEWLKAESGAKPVPPNEYADFKTAYLAKHPGTDAEDVVKAYSKEHQAPDRNDHGDNVVDPTTHKLVRVLPGGIVPEGAVSPTQSGAMNTPTTQMRNVAAQSQLVHEQTPHMISELDRLKDKLGPMSGRWNEFMQGKVGLEDPDFAGLRADLLMYSSAVALMHARGRLPENLREEFDRLINNPGQNFNNLKSVMTRIDDWSTKNPGMPGHGGAAASGGGHAIELNGKTYKYNGSGATDDMKNYTEVKK